MLSDEIKNAIEEEDTEIFDLLENVTDLREKLNNALRDKVPVDAIQSTMDSILEFRKQENNICEIVQQADFKYEDVLECLKKQHESLDELMFMAYKLSLENVEESKKIFEALKKQIDGFQTTFEKVTKVFENATDGRVKDILQQARQNKLLVDGLRVVYLTQSQNFTAQTAALDEFAQELQNVQGSSAQYINENRSNTQKFNALIANIINDAEKNYLNTGSYEFSRVETEMLELAKMMKTTRKTKDVDGYTVTLEHLLQQTQKTVVGLTMGLGNMEDAPLEEIQYLGKRTEKYTSLGLLNMQMMDLLKPGVYSQAFDKFNDTLKTAKEMTHDKIIQYIENRIHEYSDYARKGRNVSKFDHVNGEHGVLDRTIKSLAINSYYNLADDPAHMNFERSAWGYRHALDSLLEEQMATAERIADLSVPANDKQREEIIQREMRRLQNEDFKSGRYTNPLIAQNSKLLKYAKEEKVKTDTTSKNLEDAIRTTYSQIFAISHFDPHSKLLDKLYAQAKQLEEMKNDVDSTLNDKKTLQLKDFLKNPLKSAGLGTVLTLLGAGGLFSFGSWKQKVIGQANQAGSLMYQNYMLNASMNAPQSYGALNRVYGQGRTLYDITNGMVGMEAPTNMYRALVKGVGGAYGSRNGYKDLTYMAGVMTIPAQLYGLSDGVMAGFTNSLYKDNKQSAQDTMTMLMTVMENAQRANVPIEKYMRMVSSLATQMRHLGYNGKHAIGIMNYFMDEGMRVEDAHALEASILGAQTNYSMNKSNAVYAVMAGQTGNLWRAMANNMMTHDMNGDPIGNRQKMIGQQMMAELGFYMGNHVDDGMRRFLVGQKLGMMGFMPKERSILIEKLMTGDAEEVGKALEGFDEDEIKNQEKVANSVKKMAEQLKKSGETVGFRQKMQSDMIVAANKIAEHLGSHNQGMIKFEETIKSAMEMTTPLFTKFIQWIGELPSKISKFREEHGAMGGFFLSHPLFTMATVGAGIGGAMYGAYKGGKALFRHWNDPKSGGSSGGSSNSKSITQRAKDGASKAKNNLKSLSLPKVTKTIGKFLGGGKFKAIAMATGLFFGEEIGNAYASPSPDADEEDQSEEQSAKNLVLMFGVGEAKARLRKSDGTPMDLYGESAMEKWLKENLGVRVEDETVVGGAILSGLGIRKAYQVAKEKYQNWKNPYPEVPNPPKMPERETKIPAEKPLTAEEKNALKGATHESGGMMGMVGGSGKGSKFGFLKGLGGTAIFSGLYNTYQEFSSENSQYTTAQKMGRTAIDTGFDVALWGLAPRIPYGFLIPIADMAIGAIAGTSPSDVLKQKAKAYFGLSSSLDKYNREWLEAMFDETECTSDSFMELCEKRTEESNVVKDYMKQNGLDYDSMTEVEKKIWKKQMETLGGATTTLAQIMAYAIQAGKLAKQFPNNPNATKMVLAPWVLENIDKQLDLIYETEEDSHYGDVLLHIDYKMGKLKNALNGAQSEEQKADIQRQIDELTHVRRYINAKFTGNWSEYYNEAAESYQNGETLPEGMRLDKIYNIPGVKESLEKMRNGDYGYATNFGAPVIKDAIEDIAAWKIYQDNKLWYGENGWKWYIKEEGREYKRENAKQHPEYLIADPNAIQKPDNTDGNFQFPQDAINQAQMVSAKTGIPVEYILAFFYLESNGLWELSEKLHNYGNTVYQGSQGDYNGYGAYATTEEGAEALAEHTVAFSEEESREKLRQAAMADSPEAFVKQMAEKGYFTDDPEHYLALFKSGLAVARGAGITGVNSNYQGKQSSNGAPVNTKPKTILQQYKDNVSAYERAAGISKNKTIKGALVNGMYIDPTKPFVSIEEYKKQIRAQRQGWNYTPQAIVGNPAEQLANDVKQSGEDGAREEVQAANEAKVKELIDRNKALQITIQRQKEEKERIESQELDVAHLNVYGELKAGKTMAEFHEELQALLEELNLTPETVKAEADFGL